jgi:hypothetical protein
MSKNCGIWIDGKKAVLVNLAEGQVQVSEINSDIEDRVHHVHEGDKGSFMGSRHINNEKKIEERKRHQVRAFLDKVVEHAKYADAIFILGPTGMKTRLRTLISDDRQLLHKLRGVQTAGLLTEPQLKARVKSFFDEIASRPAHPDQSFK